MSSAAAWRRYRQHDERAVVLASRARDLDAESHRVHPYYSEERRRLDAMHDRCDSLADEAAELAGKWETIASRRERCERSQPFGTRDQARDLDVDTSPIPPVRARRFSVENRPPEPPTLTGPRTHAPPTRCTATPRTTFGVHPT